MFLFLIIVVLILLAFTSKISACALNNDVTEPNNRLLEAARAEVPIAPNYKRPQTAKAEFKYKRHDTVNAKVTKELNYRRQYTVDDEVTTEPNYSRSQTAKAEFTTKLKYRRQDTVQDEVTTELNYKLQDTARDEVTTEPNYSRSQTAKAEFTTKLKYRRQDIVQDEVTTELNYRRQEITKQEVTEDLLSLTARTDPDRADVAAHKFTMPESTISITRRSTLRRVSLEEECHYLAYYCLKSYKTGRVCGRTLYYNYQNFDNYCALDYVNCMERFEVWQIAHMGNCYTIPITEENLIYEYQNEDFLDQAYVA